MRCFSVAPARSVHAQTVSTSGSVRPDSLCIRRYRAKGISPERNSSQIPIRTAALFFLAKRFRSVPFGEIHVGAATPYVILNQARCYRQAAVPGPACFVGMAVFAGAHQDDLDVPGYVHFRFETVARNDGRVTRSGNIWLRTRSLPRWRVPPRGCPCIFSGSLSSLYFMKSATACLPIRKGRSTSEHERLTSSSDEWNTELQRSLPC
jgi:hypothetical protein